MYTHNDIAALGEDIRKGNRVSLGRAITLIESKRKEDRILSDLLMDQLSDHKTNSRRIAITGVPGVGKSTFIEAFGLKLIQEKQQSVAVLAIDPSSGISGGSILGDKTRMSELARESRAFIRPSPSGGHLGGVAEKTMQTILLCEAAGFDNILIETVGVGQSETEIRYMADLFILLMLPGAGDELQGIKRGIMEMADLLVMNKFDGASQENAKEAIAQFKNALHYFPPREDGWIPEILKHSVLSPDTTSEVTVAVNRYFEFMAIEAKLDKLRASQRVWWLREQIQRNWMNKLYSTAGFEEKLKESAQKVLSGELNPFKEAREILERLE